MNQDLTRIFKCAKYFYTENLYNDAVTEFYRSIFFDHENLVTDSSYYFIGLCERNLGNWQKSNNAFDRAIAVSQNPEMKHICILAQASNLIAQDFYATADFKLIKLIYSCQTENVISEAKILLFISAVLQSNWTRATELHKECSSQYSDSEQFNQVSSQLCDAILHKSKSIKIAKNLSTILPGTGQLYAHDFKNAANAFLLNSLNITLNTILFVNGYYVDGLLYLFMITQRYYNGNRYQAEQIVIKREREYNDRIEQGILETLQSFD